MKLILDHACYQLRQLRDPRDQALPISQNSVTTSSTSSSTPNQPLRRSTRTRNPVDRYAPMVES